MSFNQAFGGFPSSRAELSMAQGKELGEEQDQGKEQVARSKGRSEKMEQGAMWKEGARERARRGARSHCERKEQRARE